MHIMDGILTPTWIDYSMVCNSRGFHRRRYNNDFSDGEKPIPSICPFWRSWEPPVFIISVWHIPVAVAGSSGHPTGTGLAAIVIGPFATVVVTVIAIFFQMFLGHGGLTTIGANTVSMGIVGGFSGYATYWVARKVHASYWLAAGLAGFVGDLLTYATTSFQLAVSIYPKFWVQYFFLNMVSFSFVQVPIAIVEFAFTAVTVQYIVNHKPEILEWWHK